MSLRRRRGNVFAGSSADFDDQAPNKNSTTSSYPGTRSETSAALDMNLDDASDDPPYKPTAGEEELESRIHEDDPPRSPRRSKRLRPFYASTSETVVRERLTLIEIASDSPSSLDSEDGKEEEEEEESEGRGMSNQSSEFADDNFPAVPTTFAPVNIAHESASVSASVDSRSTPRAAHRRKQNRPFRCPVM